MTIIETARKMLSKDGAKLVKTEEIKSRLANPNTSVYAQESASIKERGERSMDLGSILAQEGEISENDQQDFDRPIVDILMMQKGFYNSSEIIYSEEVAPAKALLAAEGGISEGKYYHTGVITEIRRTSGYGSLGLEDADTARFSTDIFAKRDQRGGWDPEKETVTRVDNVSGLLFVSPVDMADPEDPEAGNLLGDIASGISYRLARPYYDIAAGFDYEDRFNIMMLCTRNANGPVLDRLARETIISNLALDVTKAHDQKVLAQLLATFRQARGSICVTANSPTGQTLRIGLPHSEHSVSSVIKWSNEQKRRHVKKMVTSSGEVIYMASAYLNHQLFTVPVDLDLVESEILEDLAGWQQQALRFCVNQSRKILGFSPKALDTELLGDLEKYVIDEYPTVYEALGLSPTDSDKAKSQIYTETLGKIHEIIADYQNAVATKAMDVFTEMQEG